MSMVGVFRRVSQRVIDEVRADPNRIKTVLFPPATETMIDDDVRLDIDKAWAGLHYLLTGDPTGEEAEGPLAFILGGGQVVGDIDVGYGPARSFSSAEVRKTAAALALVNANTLRARFDPAVMMAEDIYPAIWDRDPADDDTFGYLLAHFAALKDFVTTTAQAEAGMLVYLV